MAGPCILMTGDNHDARHHAPIPLESLEVQFDVRSLIKIVSPLVAERILRFANLVGRERVIAATDCGLGGRVHPQIAWEKLEILAQGAALASRQLWR